MSKTLFDRRAACDSVLQAVFFLSSVPDCALTSFQRAPALLDTYTLGLLAKFLPTDPATRGQKGILHSQITGAFPEYYRLDVTTAFAFTLGKSVTQVLKP